MFFAVYLIIFGLVPFCCLTHTLTDTHTHTHTHTHTPHQTDSHTLTQENASGCTYRHKLPVPFGGRLESKRQEREEGLGRYKVEEQQTSQGSYTVDQIRSVTMETDLILKTTGKG